MAASRLAGFVALLLLAGPAWAGEAVIYLEVKSTPPGATVHLDGRYVGVTPLRLPIAPDRKYALKVTKFGFQPFVQAIEPTMQNVVIEVPLASVKKGTLVISSQPSEAEVLLDGRSCGKTPLTLEDIDAGQHDLRIQKSNFIFWEGTLEVAAGEQTEVSRELAPRFVNYYAEAIQRDPDNVENYAELASQCILYGSFAHGRGAVLTALRLFGDRQVNDRERAIARVMKASEGMHWEQASRHDVQGLAELLASRDGQIRQHVLAMIRVVNPATALPVLMEQLRDRDYDVRQVLAGQLAVGDMNPPLEKLVAALTELGDLLEYARTNPYQMNQTLEKYAALAQRYEQLRRLAGTTARVEKPPMPQFDTVYLLNGDRIDANVLSLQAGQPAKLACELTGGTLDVGLPEIDTLRFAGVASQAEAKDADRVFFSTGDLLSGSLVSFREDELKLNSPMAGALDLKPSLVRVVVLGQAAPPPHGQPSGEDRVFFTNGNRLSGKLLAMSKDDVRMKCAFGEVKFGRDRVAAVVLGRRPVEPKKPEKGIEVELSLANGDHVCGMLDRLDKTRLRLRTDVAGELKLPREALASALLSDATEWERPFDQLNLAEWRRKRGQWERSGNTFIGNGRSEYYCFLSCQPFAAEGFVLDYRVEILSLEEAGSASIGLWRRPEDEGQGYSLELTEDAFWLGYGWRGRQVVVKSTVNPTGKGPHHVRFVKRGRIVSAFLDGLPAFRHEMDEPFDANHLALCANRAHAAFSEIRMKRLDVKKP